jgi:Low psii accumulation1 / Rep27
MKFNTLPIQHFLVVAFLSLDACAFSPTLRCRSSVFHAPLSTPSKSIVFLSSPNGSNSDDGLGEKFGGYTVKQRLREEVESPFRKVRLLFFLSTVGSALTALYFSGMGTVKALVGGYSDAPPLEQALQNDAINLTGAIVCGFLALREYNLGQSNLQRLAKGGQLARLVVEPAADGEKRRTVADYRRASRVLIAAGGLGYITELARSLSADQRSDPNTIPTQLENSEVVVVPVLLKMDRDGKVIVENTRECWVEVQGRGEDIDRNFDIKRADSVIAFPRGNSAWTDYLESEIETASGQGFNVLEKGFTITVKKNGRILRRATGQPPWDQFLGAMEVLDGSRFGMPGDSERYGGP